MAKITYLFSVIASSQTLVRCRDACADPLSCSATPDHSGVSKSAALLQVSKKARKEGASATAATDEAFRQTVLPTQSELGELLARVQSLEAVASHPREDVVRTEVASGKALDDKTVDAALLARALDKSHIYSGISQAQETRDVAEVGNAFATAVEEKVAERKALADKAAFDAAVEKAVDEKLASEGIFPVPATEERTLVPLPAAAVATQQVITGRAGGHILDEKLHTNFDTEEKDVKKHGRHERKGGGTAKVEKGEHVREEASSKGDKIDGGGSRWIGDDMSENYEQKKSHVGHTARGHGAREDRSEAAETRHDHQSIGRNHHSKTDDDYQETEVEQENRHSRKGHSQDNQPAEDSFDEEDTAQEIELAHGARGAGGKARGVAKRHYEANADMDEDVDADESRYVIVEKEKAKRSQKARREMVEMEKPRLQKERSRESSDYAEANEEEYTTDEWNAVSKKGKGDKRMTERRRKVDHQDYAEANEEEYANDEWNAVSKKGKGDKRMPERRRKVDHQDEDEDARKLWSVVSRKLQENRDAKERHEKVQPEVIVGLEEQRGHAAKKGNKKSKDTGRRVIVDPKERYNDDFPYEMLMDVDFIVDSTPAVNSIEDIAASKGHTSRAHQKTSQHSEKQDYED